MQSRFTFTSDGLLRGSDEFGLIAVHFESVPSNLRPGQTTDLQIVKAGSAMNWEIVSQDYSEPMSFELQVIRQDYEDIEPEMERYLNKLFCKRGEYGWFMIQDPRYADIWMKANFSNPNVFYYGGCKGLQYTVTLDSAVVYSAEKTVEFSVEANEFLPIYINSDEQVPIYPCFDITPLTAGELIIENDREINEDYFTEIKEVDADERLKIDGNLPTLSSPSNPNIWDNFNLRFPRVYDGINMMTFSLPCQVIMKYREYRKLVVI